MVQQAEIGGAAARPLPLSLLRLARPTQWSKSAFCLIGPFYGLRELAETRPDADLAEVAAAALGAALLAAVAFALASSGCYVLNDLADREADRLHPRKRRRPIASGAVGARLAVVYAAVLLAAGLGCAALVPGGGGAWVAQAVALHV